MSSLVVLGATSAISQAYLNRVSSRYESITLVARNREHLQQVSDHVSTIATGTVDSVVADLADIAAHPSLITGLKSPMDTVLICYGELSDQARCVADPAYAEQQFRLNGTSAISLAARVAASMVEQGSGVLAVVGSVAGDRGRQSNYYYGAAKGALDTFLSGLRGDVLSAGVRVVTVKPGFVDTPMTREFKKGLLWVKPEKIAKGIDRAVTGRADVIYTPWFWRFIMLVIKAVPEVLFKRLKF
jgi:short-subunit dehydrogenase